MAAPAGYGRLVSAGSARSLAGAIPAGVAHAACAT
jgi:hypothetical protein